MQSFFQRSACSLQRLEITDFGPELTQSLHTIPSLLELRLYYPRGTTEAILIYLSVELTCLPRLKRLELWHVEPEFLIEDSETLLDMLEARWRSLGPAERLQAVHIHFHTSTLEEEEELYDFEPDSGILERFCSLAGDGMDFSFELGTSQGVQKLSWF